MVFKVMKNHYDHLAELTAKYFTFCFYTPLPVGCFFVVCLFLFGCIAAGLMLKMLSVEEFLSFLGNLLQ